MPMILKGKRNPHSGTEKMATGKAPAVKNIGQEPKGCSS